jgi:hypothetical protein
MKAFIYIIVLVLLLAYSSCAPDESNTNNEKIIDKEKQIEETISSVRINTIYSGNLAAYSLNEYSFEKSGMNYRIYKIGEGVCVVNLTLDSLQKIILQCKIKAEQCK